MSDKQETPPDSPRSSLDLKVKFEAIGRYVQAFEQMVEAARAGIIFLIESPGQPASRINMILHHRVMTAGPLFEIFRAIAESRVTESLSGKDKDDFRSLLKQVGKGCQTAFETRNDWLHGTWYIGWETTDDAPGDLVATKFKVDVGKGVLAAASMPKDVTDINAERKRCEDLTDILFHVPIAITTLRLPQRPNFSNYFRKETDVWIAVNKMSRPPD